MISRAPVQALDIRRKIPGLTSGGRLAREERGQDGLARLCCKALGVVRVRGLKLLASEDDQAQQGDTDGSCAIIIVGEAADTRSWDEAKLGSRGHGTNQSRASESGCGVHYRANKINAVDAGGDAVNCWRFFAGQLGGAQYPGACTHQHGRCTVLLSRQRERQLHIRTWAHHYIRMEKHTRARNVPQLGRVELCRA